MKVQEIFGEAVKIESQTGRKQYLDGVCAGDPQFRARVEELLAAHGEAGSFLESPAGQLPEDLSPTATFSTPKPIAEAPGTIVGRYKLLQQIGEGGMGVVYMAEQEKPVRRRVALKIIKPGMDSAQVIARFEAERQALAMMDHPNIARVLDAGCTDAGRPYFVMELVQGVPITKYCDDKQLDTRARLDLFMHVCNAVQHAHQKGIIHRDLKPSNVLVMIYDSKPVPKIIDFGVAKALHQRLTEATLFTQFGAVVGTLEYMSPEQAEMDALGTDTRSDIYSLGVLLYELLTGTTPLDGKKLRSLGYAEMLKTIREVDPPRPSTRLTQSTLTAADISAKRQTEPRRLQKLVAGDLDLIVMKCLEKDRTRRYETANGLALDIQRHLHDEAVTASPPGQLYKLHKMVRRNKLACTAAACVSLALVLGLAASLWQADRASREAERALSAEHHAIATLDELRATVPTFIADAHTLATKGEFDLAIEKLNYAAKLQPDAPEIPLAKGDLYLCQLKLPEAAAGYRDALRLQPDLAPAAAKATLCDQLLAAPTSAKGKLDLESLVKIYSALVPEKRSDAELKAVKDAYADENERLWKYWLPRLQSLPMFAHLPPGEDRWEGRFEVRNDGQLRLFLGDLDASDLSQLKDLPVADLYLANCRNVADVQPLADMPSLENITVPPLARNIEALRKLPKLKRLAFSYKEKFSPDEQVRQQDQLASSLLNLAQKQEPGSDLSSDQEAFTRRAMLFNINERWDSRTPDTTAEEFWKDYPTLSGLSRLRDSAIKPHDISRRPDGTWSLNFDNQKELADLSFLHGMPISFLWLGGTSVADLSPLRGMPLKELSLWGTKVADLTPLEGMPISTLDISGISTINDLSPLKGMPIDYLALDGTTVSDLTPLRGMPLTTLRLKNCAKLTDLSPLADARQLTQLSLPPNYTDFEFLHSLPKLERLSFDLDKSYNPDKTTDEFWAANAEGPWLTALRKAGLKPQTTKQKDGTYDVNLGNSDIRDLTPLKGAPISILRLGHTPVTDLAPLHGMKLKKLALNDTAVADLAPLHGMPIEDLSLSNSKVVDLSPLRGMPLKILSLRNCTTITDFSPLAECRSLTTLTLPSNAKDIAFLRSFPALEHISFTGDLSGSTPQTAKEFWAGYDKAPPATSR